MISNTQIGTIGEKIACEYLVQNAFIILENNWRYKKAEIDIIAKQDDILVFVEVKTRSSTFFGKPEEAITEKKEALIIDAAQRYMESINHHWEIRFDIISIILDKNYQSLEINHFKDAFFY